MLGLKEIKIPKYAKGMDYSDYIIKLYHAAGTRGRMKEAISGGFFNLMPPIVGNHGQLTQEQEQMLEENNRALAELVMAMPSRSLTRLISKACSDAFPNGCATTAMELFKKKVRKISSCNEGSLKEQFESGEKLTKGINPGKYMERLINIRDELSEKYQYIKTDQDVLDQIIKVLNSNYDWTKNELKKARR